LEGIGASVNAARTFTVTRVCCTSLFSIFLIGGVLFRAQKSLSSSKDERLFHLSSSCRQSFPKQKQVDAIFLAHDTNEPMRVLKSNVGVWCLFGARVQSGPKKENAGTKKTVSCPESKEARGH
jgi:hypothetical protein